MLCPINLNPSCHSILTTVTSSQLSPAPSKFTLRVHRTEMHTGSIITTKLHQLFKLWFPLPKICQLCSLNSLPKKMNEFLIMITKAHLSNNNVLPEAQEHLAAWPPWRNNFVQHNNNYNLSRQLLCVRIYHWLLQPGENSICKFTRKGEPSSSRLGDAPTGIDPHFHSSLISKLEDGVVVDRILEARYSLQIYQQQSEFIILKDATL